MKPNHFPITEIPPEVCDPEDEGCGRVLVYEMGIHALRRMHWWCAKGIPGPKDWRKRCPFPPKEPWQPIPVELKIPIGEMGHENPCGWLAPDGKFYGCNFEHHESLASHLLKFFFNEVSYRADTLREKGWVYIGKHGIYTADKTALTKKQKEVLTDLYLAGKQDAKAKKSQLIKHLEWDVEDWEK